MFMYSALNRFFTKIHLRYEDLEEEQEYVETKTPAISNFLKVTKFFENFP